ncbi:filamin A protein cher isoform X3 [Bombus vancouverensis nearcticus]|uniref:filamin A protein cher isoform X3 n=1 Tax=Bombus vancouverensis nearcticus TaxID=2705178 RepID=UPI00143B70B7|nr:filamin-A isoform X1 [Bombus vancouverensis nearcticus]
MCENDKSVKCENAEEEDDDMFEQDLLEDAQWKRTQQNTFTRWANEKLKTVNRQIDDLECDLSDGLLLISLIEVLAQKKLPKHSQKPVFRSQKLENVSVALKFLDDEGIRIVNIDSTDIVDSKLKLILGLIWTLILHYSISMPLWNGEEGSQTEGPKQRLIKWIKNKVPELVIGNFTTDWNDGRAIGALVDGVASGLCPDWHEWNKNDAIQNASEAMQLADDWLNIPQLIKPEEMVNPNIDEMSMMTYLSQYPNAKLKPGAPLRPRINRNSIPPPRVRAYGPGIEPSGVVIGAPTNFTVETLSAGKGDVEVIVEDFQGMKLPVDIKFNRDKNLTYSVSYTPKTPSPHKVQILYAGKEIPKSPYVVNVETPSADPSKIVASGPGLQADGILVNKPTFFDIFTKTAGRGAPVVTILDEEGLNVPFKLRQTLPEVWRCEYTPTEIGVHTIKMSFAGKSIPGSPCNVNVGSGTDAKKCRAYGRGLLPNGVRAHDNVDFVIVTKDAGEDVLGVKIIGPGGVSQSVHMVKIDQKTYKCNYTPMKEGRYVVMITYGGKEIYKSPFEVNVGPYKESAIRAYGPGLHGGIVDHTAKFIIDTQRETAGLGFAIEGPSEAKIFCHDNGDGTGVISYLPTAPGQYAVHIRCDNEDIPKSPYIVNILPKGDFDPDKVEVYGPGIQAETLPVGKPTNFTVDVKKAGQAPLEVVVQDIQGKDVPVRLEDNHDGTVQCHYTPTSASNHVIMVIYGGVATKHSPYRVKVEGPLNVAMLSAYGPGLEKGVKSNIPTHFIVDCREVGPGELRVNIKDSDNKEIPFSLSDNKDGTHTITYVAREPGTCSVNLNYGGLNAPQCPIKVNVESHIDISEVKVEGLAQTAPVNSLQQFLVITQDAGKPADFQVTITAPSGNRIKAHVIPIREGYLVNFTPTELGEYLLGISFGGVPISNQPYRLTCVHGSDPEKVRASGPGLTHGIINKPAEFVIDTRGAGQGNLGVTVEGPCEAAINCRDNGDGTCSVAYLPTEVGDYGINITFNEKHIPGSPFQAIVVKDVDVSKIKVTGTGIQPNGPCVNRATEFTVDARALPKAKNDHDKLSCIINNPSGNTTEKVIALQRDGTYCVSYKPFEEGPHTIDIRYDNIPVPGSPFTVNVKYHSDPSKCKAYGPGLKKGFVNKYNTFVVETKDAGNGGLSLLMEGNDYAQVTCKGNDDGYCTVEYFPPSPGDYEISIKFAEQHIPGSPFQVQVVDDMQANNVTAYGEGLKVVRENISTKFMVNTSKCNPAQLNVTLKTNKGRVQKPIIKNCGNGLFEVTYQPPSPDSDLQVGVIFDGEDIPGSPFKPKVLPTVEPNKVAVTGLGVAPVCTASFPVDFVVDTSEAGYGDLEVQVLGPDQVPRKVEIQDLGDGKYKATYLPDDCGRYKVNVKYGDKEIPGCPINVQSLSTGRAEKCKIKEGIQRTLAQGEEYCITVDTENAGRGAVTCRIRSTSGSEVVDIDIEDNGDGTVNIYYTVADAGDYTLSIKFGGQPIPEGFYTFTASEEYREHSTHKTHRAKRTRQKEEQHVVKQHSSTVEESSSVSTRKNFNEVRLNNILLPLLDGTVTSEVKMPSGNMDKPIITDNRDGTVSIKYDPKEEGQHELAVKFNGEHVQGSPFRFHVDSLANGYVTAYGPGLIYGVCGEPGNFSISTKDVGPGGLSLSIEGPGKATISCHDNKDGTISVSYLPTDPGEYKIGVIFGGKHIRGSPFSAKITGEGRKRNQISVGSSSEVQLPGKITDSDVKSLNASITAPSGLEEPCFLKMLPNGNMCVSFTPREAGPHTVAVKKMGKHVQNSPFKIDVKDREVGDAKKVKVSGPGLVEGKTHVENNFSIDTRNAGFGGLSLSVEGPSKAEIQCKDNEDGTLNISYKPTEPGYYIINLKFADHHVEGSPFTIKVTGEGSNRQREKIQRQREAVPITEVGSQCKITFKIPGITSFDLTATVTSPGGVTEDAEIKEVEDGLYAVAFVPKELGVHTVSVRYKDIHIPGSPFQFTVGPFRDSGAHRVHAGGPGLERGEQGEPCEFNIWTREAGAGTLAVSVEGPSKAQIDFKDRKDGSCYVSYVVSEPGEYRVGIKFNDQHIPDSPHKLYISPAMGDAHKLEVAQFPESGVQPDKPAIFLVRKNGAKGELDAKIVSPSGIEDDCFIQGIDADTYSVRFMPRENGIHNIHVKFNGVHIQGSPYRIKVGKVDADPAALHAYGNGLKEIKTGQKTDFIIDTCNAGSGVLCITVDGPSKVAMDCTEVEEGYKVRYTPLVPGDYYISIKYDGYHIVGSPFKVPCTGADLAERGAQETSSIVVETVQKISKSKHAGPVLPLFKSDASKVTSKGMGLKKAYLGKQNVFTVNAGDAGNNILYIGVYGPKGPCDEVSMKHIGRNNYNVNYLVRERGEYIVIVKWGDDHIPGSPYKVEV